DAELDEKGGFKPPLPLRKVSFVVSKAALAQKGGGKDVAKLTMLLGDPAFTYTQGESVLRFRLLDGSTALVDRTFTDLGIASTSLDSNSGATLYKMKNAKDAEAADQIAKFKYTNSNGKMTLAMKGLTLDALAGNEAHLGFELTVGEKIYFTTVTLFAPKTGKWTTTMPK
ncbi:MAG: hypothetical protein ACYTDX_03540, partial [Planctomycetota bacterium]